MTRERLERIVAGLDEMARRIAEIRSQASEAMIMLPERRVPKRDDRKTKSYVQPSQVDASGLSKPVVACQHSGCMRPSGETAYCDEHADKVRG